MELVVYVACVILTSVYAYQLGECNGNQKGFEECSKIWQSGGFKNE